MRVIRQIWVMMKTKWEFIAHPLQDKNFGSFSRTPGGRGVHQGARRWQSTDPLPAISGNFDARTLFYETGRVFVR